MTSPNQTSPDSNQFRLTGPYREKYDERQFALDSKSWRDSVGVLPGEIQEKTPELVNAINQVHEGMVLLGDDVGVDIRGRLPGLNHYHLFADSNNYSEALQQIGIRPVSEGMALIDKGIFIVLKSNHPNYNVSVIAHELAHFVSSFRLILHPDAHQQNSFSVDSWGGFSAQSHASEEWMSDMMMQEDLRRVGVDPPLYTYPWLDAIGDALVNRAAGQLGVDPSVLALRLVKGKLAGRTTLRLLARGLPNEQMARFLGLDTKGDRDYYVDQANQLELPEVAGRIRDDNFVPFDFRVAS